jgi:hypothetical protein
MSGMRIEPFTPAGTAEASRTLARAFVTNPLHVAAFGADRLTRNEAFFRTGLAAMKGPKLVAVEGSQILGLIHWVPSTRAHRIRISARSASTPAHRGKASAGS